MPVTSSVPIADVQSDFTPSSGGDNFAMVDEDIRDSDSTYNESSTQGDRDLFTFGNMNIPSTADIDEVLLKAYMREVAMDVNMGFSWQVVGITDEASFGIGTTYGKKTQDITAGRSWVPADFDGPLKGGYYHDQMQSRAARVTTMWPEVRWTPIQPTRSPGTVVNDASHGSVAWVNLNQTLVSDDLYAGVPLPLNDISNYNKCTNFAFTLDEVPDHHIINGIEVYVESNEASTGNTVVLESLRLVVGGVIQGDDKAAGQVLTNRDESIKGGSPTDKFGLALTPALVRATGFGVAVAFEHTVGAAPSLTNVDNIVIVVHSSPISQIIIY